MKYSCQEENFSYGSLWKKGGEMKRHDKYLQFVNEVFDKVKEKLGFSTDVELAEWLNDNKGNVSSYRSGKRVLNDWKLIRACKEVGISLPEALNMIVTHKSLSADAKEALNDILELINNK